MIEKTDEWRQRRRQQWRDWRARNKEKLLAKRQRKKLESLPHIKSIGYQIVGLYDPRDNTKQIRFITLKHTNSTAGWRELFNICHLIDSPLANWFKLLCKSQVTPKETVIIGGGVPLNQRNAIRLLNGLVATLGADLNAEPMRGRTRPVVVLDESGGLQSYPTVRAASRGIGLSVKQISDRLTLMRGVYDGTAIYNSQNCQ